MLYECIPYYTLAPGVPRPPPGEMVSELVCSASLGFGALDPRVKQFKCSGGGPLPSDPPAPFLQPWGLAPRFGALGARARSGEHVLLSASDPCTTEAKA